MGYRKNVVMENLANAFADKTEVERNELTSGFYHYMTDLLVEIL